MYYDEAWFEIQTGQQSSNKLLVKPSLAKKGETNRIMDEQLIHFGLLLFAIAINRNCNRN